jgi:hypothetical protein
MSEDPDIPSAREPLEEEQSSEAAAARDAAGARPHWQFKPGQSGNPAGRPKGSRNRTTLCWEPLVPGGDGAALVRQALQGAFAGDAVMQRAFLHKLVSPARRRPVTLDLPEDASPTDLDALMDATCRALAAGEVTPEEANEIAAFVRARIGARLAGLRARRIEADLAQREREAQSRPPWGHRPDYQAFIAPYLRRIAEIREMVEGLQQKEAAAAAASEPAGETEKTL